MTRRLTTQERLLRAISEEDWQREVQNTAELYGWRWYHPPKNRPVKDRRTGRYHVQDVRAGFPDLTLVHPGRRLFLVAELKKETGTLEPEQIEWLTDLRAAGIRAEVWRPRDRELVRAILGPEARGWHEYPASGLGAAVGAAR